MARDGGIDSDRDPLREGTGPFAVDPIVLERAGADAIVP